MYPKDPSYLSHGIPPLKISPRHTFPAVPETKIFLQILPGSRNLFLRNILQIHLFVPVFLDLLNKFIRTQKDLILQVIPDTISPSHSLENKRSVFIPCLFWNL